MSIHTFARRRARSFAALLLTVATAAALMPTGAGAAPAASASAATSTCFWQGPIEPSNPAYNIAFPDAGAVYWTAQFTLPVDAHLTVDGDFPHSRYMSFNAYDQAGSPTDALHDTEIAPDRGSHNPFDPWGPRFLPRRAFHVDVRNQPAPTEPTERTANTLYAGVPSQAVQSLVYRIYVPDHGATLTGGVALPNVQLVLADGTVLSGQSLCDAIQARTTIVPVQTLPRPIYDSLRNQAGAPPTFPASPAPVFHRHFSVPSTLGCIYQAQCGGAPALNPGQYANLDAAYVYAMVNRGFGPVLVLQGRMPRTPKTLWRNLVMAEREMRYWSICQNESFATTRGAGCVHDQQVPVDAAGNFTIVTSLAADRPSNATASCGVAWIPWPEEGDGAGHPDDGMVIMRNMLPSPDFDEAIQNVAEPGTEASVMGPYLPIGSYTDVAGFEARGCSSTHRWFDRS